MMALGRLNTYATIVLVVAFAHIAPGQTRPVEPPPGLDQLHAIAEGYLANRGGFTVYRCEFDYARGHAPGVDAAFKDGPTFNRLTAKCTMAVDGKNICYTRIIDPKARAAMRQALQNPQPMNLVGQGGFAAEIQLDELLLLTDGTRMLRYDPGFVANLMGPNRIGELLESLGPETHPWNLGGAGETMNTNLGRWILAGKLGTWTYKGTTQIDGRELLTIECTRPESRWVYHCDPKRGYLPVQRYWRNHDGQMSQIHLRKIEACSNGRFFPTDIMIVDTRPDGSVWRVSQLTVTKLDADYRPRPADFVIEVRRGEQLCHVDNLRSAFRLTANERYGPNDLEPLHKRCLDTIKQRDLEDGR